MIVQDTIFCAKMPKNMKNIIKENAKKKRISQSELLRQIIWQQLIAKSNIING